MEYFKHFADKSQDYLKYRPTYPDALFQFILKHVKNRDCVWDCATGNGQAAHMLAPYFKKVIASDINQEQIDQAPRLANVVYGCWPSEQSLISEHSVDLVTVAQALHWFDFDNFYKEVKRVTKVDGVIAAWCYDLSRINPAIDVVVKMLYDVILGSYWPKERRYIDEGYRTLPFPFKKIVTPPFQIKLNWNLEDFVGYLNTWSAVKAFTKINGTNPIDQIIKPLTEAWQQSSYAITWDIHLLLAKTNE